MIGDSHVPRRIKAHLIMIIEILSAGKSRARAECNNLAVDAHARTAPAAHVDSRSASSAESRTEGERSAFNKDRACARIAGVR